MGWYGFGTDTTATRELLTNYWITWSTDQGETWALKQPVTPRPFDLRTAPYNTGFFFGEYQGLVAVGQSFVSAVTLTNGHSLQNRTDIYACTFTPGDSVARKTATVCGGALAR